MNLPNVFQLLAGDSSVTDIIGTSPTRCYLFGDAPQGEVNPFVTWSVVVSTPENHLTKLPVVDADRVQIDAYALDQQTLVTLCGRIRDAIEPHAHMITKINMGKDPDTDLFRWVLEFRFFTSR